MKKLFYRSFEDTFTYFDNVTTAQVDIRNFSDSRCKLDSPVSPERIFSSSPGQVHFCLFDHMATIWPIAGKLSGQKGQSVVSINWGKTGQELFH